MMYATADTHGAEDALEDDSESLSALPELMSDDEYGDHSGAATPRASSRPSNQSNNPHVQTFLRCPDCGHVLKWVFVDQVIGGEHQIHQCQARCGCESSAGFAQPRKNNENEGEMFQVNRDLW